MKQVGLGTILILTGSRGAGKTTLCNRLIDEARVRGWQVAGVLSPAQFDRGEKTGIQAQDVRTQSRRPLAKRRSSKNSPSTPPATLDTQTWKFEESALAWGNQLLKAAVPCDLLVIDELGPLEFEQGKGWSAGFEAVDSRRYRFAVVVIRPHYVESARKRWPDSLVLDLSAMPLDQLEQRIRSILF